MFSISAAHVGYKSIPGISWRNHVTNEEEMRRAGMKRIQDIVSTMRRTVARNTLLLQSEIPAHVTVTFANKMYSMELLS